MPKCTKIQNVHTQTESEAITHAMFAIEYIHMYEKYKQIAVTCKVQSGKHKQDMHVMQ